MFDVIWTDPNVENVGERRARKQQEKAEGVEQRGRTYRSSTSRRTSRSSRDSSLERPFFFSSRSSKSTSRSESRSKTRTPSTLLPTKTTTADGASSRRNSLYSVSENPRLQSPLKTPDGTYVPSEYTESCDPSPSSSSRGSHAKLHPHYPHHPRPAHSFSGLLESVFSRLTDRSGSGSTPSVADSISTKASFIQTLGPASYVTKTTEVAITTRSQDDDSDRGSSEVRISAETPRSRHELLPPPPFTPVSNSHTGNRPSSRHDNSHLHPPVSVGPTVVLGTLPFSPSNPDAWKPPGEWDYIPSHDLPATIPVREKVRPVQRNDSNPMSLDLNGMMRELKRMAAASPKLTLLRLSEEWGKSTDAMLYKELEMEKKRWMLAALYNIDRNLEQDLMERESRSPVRQEKILALYENQATASFLAGIYRQAEVYHLSTAPLCNGLYPNIVPVSTPFVLPHTFPLAPRLFHKATALSLPSLFPSTEVPTVLRQLHRCLTSKGKIQLTIIDPSPNATTLGPKLRQWLDDNLLLNLEKNFRCINPSRLFPIWMADAKLRADGSSITTVKFMATTIQDQLGPLGAHDMADDASSIRAQLRSLVGRMLWLEVWGGYIHASKWWWEDPDIMEECNSLGTYWEFNLIEGVKE
ncbi:hypothetical protein MKZ38_000702 [Zalerion maritima]|uniref:Methyltransferase type 11 domain-containing protein n=1 Tax=Zalerion maritima TaxID=339359 RepID=A0AAD5RR51_9PEZI|nr:hypothetical protein MKZ38_000702 [Zalerion maritima]